ncbi:MAG: hypothetical protein UX75_C0059G0009 [Candidatus Moranbacteria bacterium GW2011_GWE2_47_10]|nr:MAG: hypothetical protein UX75_C0059G0009 [Candidatus Moranbacteria bacterium GW2011_GWE2_47_10]
MFAETYNEFLEVAQKQVNKGVYGAMSAAKQRLEFMLNAQYDEKKVLADWDKTVKDHAPTTPDLPGIDVPLVHVEEDN